MGDKINRNNDSEYWAILNAFSLSAGVFGKKAFFKNDFQEFIQMLYSLDPIFCKCYQQATEVPIFGENSKARH